MIEVTVKHVFHAAHYVGSRTGHDLEVYTFASNTNVKVKGVHKDAEYHSGYVEKGIQHWMYVRIMPFSKGYCKRCEK